MPKPSLVSNASVSNPETRRLGMDPGNLIAVMKAGCHWRVQADCEELGMVGEVDENDDFHVGIFSSPWGCKLNH